MRQMWHAMGLQRGRLAAAAFFGVIAAASTVALLGTSGWLISYAAELPPVLSLSVAAVMVRSFALSRSVFRYLERLVGHDAAFRGLTELRVRIYDRLEQLSPVGLMRFGRGDLLARLVADVDAALDLPLRVVLPWVQAAIVSAATVAFLAWLVPGAGLALGLVLILGLVVVPWIVARIAARSERRLAPTRGALSASVVTSLDGAADLVAFGAVDAALADIERRDRELTAVARRESAGLGLGVGLSTALQGAAVVACLVAAIPAVTEGRIGPAWLAVAALLPLAAYDIVALLPSSALAYQRVRGSAARLNEVLDAPEPVRDPRHAQPMPHPPLPLRCRGLVAGWTDEPVLRGIDLDVAAGERVAIVGPSGAGKSTLAMVLLRFLGYASGSVKLDGSELSALVGDEVRDEVGLLTQDAHIFDTSVRENLHLGDPRASDDRLRAVLARVGLAAWLTHLPRGLDADLGPHGAAMSGGERQRLALARLLLAERRLLVLDEPTEHLDPRAADELTDDVLTVTAGCSTLLITHRLRGLDRVDRVVVVIAGQVRAVGSHAELVAQGGWYSERWRAEQERGDLAALMETIPEGTAAVR
ncbi:MAG: thiol reductant ABC exporter subunit CydC [Candidatus Nanopelagicales bacterium]